MFETAVSNKSDLTVSLMAENLIGSEIIKLAADVNEKIKNGERIFNYTIGDFDPKIFPLPQELTDAITQAYQNGHTNYPAANGMSELRKAVSSLLHERLHLNYTPDEILIAGGARPLIYGTYVTLLNPGDTVVFPVPSWRSEERRVG